MRKAITVMGFTGLILLGAGPGMARVAYDRQYDQQGLAGADPREVSEGQYEALIRQCRYAEAQTPAECVQSVRENYRIGRADPELDCRTYSSVTLCGNVVLSDRERQCVVTAVKSGLAYRRAEVECYAFY